MRILDDFQRLLRGFRKIGKINDPQGNQVWRSEKRVKNDEARMTNDE